jgi:hypothetical protein
MAQRPTIKLGMSGKSGTPIGDAIFLWRQFVGLPPAKGVTSFDFGKQTHEKTIAWQKKEGLSANGIVNAENWARYDSLQYGPPTPEAHQAAEELKTPVEEHPAAVQVSEVIKTKTPAPKPSGAAVAASEKIAASGKPPSSESHLDMLKQQVGETKNKITKVVESAPLWLRVTGTTVGVVVALKSLKKLFNL